MYRQQYPDAPGMHSVPSSGTRVTYNRNPNFLERIKDSFVTFIVGLALVAVAVGLLFWNEGRAVQTAQSLEEGILHVLQLPTIDVSFEENNGKLVHLIGPLRTNQLLFDEKYQVALHAVKLRRIVEMFQWVEYEHRRETSEGSETRVEISYSYSEEWKSQLINSNAFDNSIMYRNPDSIRIPSVDYLADDTRVGNFHVSSGLLESVTYYNQLIPKQTPTSDPSLKVYNGYYYHSEDPQRPKVGDMRVKFEYAGLSGPSTAALGPPQKVSIIAQQVGDRLGPYETEAGDTLELLYMGEYSPQQMFGREQAQNTMITWGVRAGGWLLMFVAFGCISTIILTLVDWIPVVRELVSLGLTTMNLALSISLSLTVIALAWIRYRPWLGLLIIVAALSPFIYSKVRRGRRTSREL